jgi:hypothetical protein
LLEQFIFIFPNSYPYACQVFFIVSYQRFGSGSGEAPAADPLREHWRVPVATGPTIPPSRVRVASVRQSCRCSGVSACFPRSRRTTSRVSVAPP